MSNTPKPVLDADMLRRLQDDAIDSYDGLIKSYTKPFTRQNHDAIGPGDYIFTYFKGNEILPLVN